LANVVLDATLSPGEGIKLPLTVTAPNRPGRYVLAVFLRRAPETLLPRRPITRTNDMALVPFVVQGGDKLTFLDLTKHFTVDGVAREEEIKGGDLDGNGNSFPAEWFVPDRYGINRVPNLAVPSGYFADIASDNARFIAFRYAPTDKGNNALVCNGQMLAVPTGRYLGLHVAAAFTGKEDNAPLAVTFHFKDKTTLTITRLAGQWTKPLADDEAPALRSPRLRGAGGDTATPVTLRHVVLPVGVGKELVSITLPKNPDVKIFAATLER
jgi:hypothetical protein